MSWPDFRGIDSSHFVNQGKLVYIPQTLTDGVIAKGEEQTTDVFYAVIGANDLLPRGQTNEMQIINNLIKAEETSINVAIRFSMLSVGFLTRKSGEKWFELMDGTRCSILDWLDFNDRRVYLTIRLKRVDV